MRGGGLRALGVRLGRSGFLHPTAFKVLAFALACLVVLAVLAAKIGNISFFSHRVAYQAELADATGLRPSDDVKIAGVTVGEVTGVTLQRAHALVSFSVNDDVHLRRGTQVGLQWHNVIGQQFLYLYPAGRGPVLTPGSVLPLSSNVAGADVGALLNALGPLLAAIHPQQANQIVQSFADALQGDESEIDQLIDNAASVSDTVGSVDTQVGQVIGNLNQVFSALSQRSGDLGAVIANLQSLSQSLSSHNDLLDQTLGNLGTAAGELATIESDTHGSLSSAISDLQAVSSEIQSHNDELSQGLTTLGPGLAAYTDISGYGQWFEIQTVYTCLANETTCSYYEAGNPPAGSGPAGSLPAWGLPGPAGSSASTGAPAPAGVDPSGALSGGAPGTAAPFASVGQVFGMVAGTSAFTGSGS